MPIGVSLPIQNGTNGYFNQTYDTFSTYKFDLLNLLNTIPNERRFSPFGCRLWTMVFEPNSDLLGTQIQNIITEDVSNWIGGISINSVNIQTSTLTDNNVYQLQINFTVTSTNQSDSLTVIFNPNYS